MTDALYRQPLEGRRKSGSLEVNIKTVAVASDEHRSLIIMYLYLHFPT